MKVIFSHGLESGPWGTKIQRMAELAQTLEFSVESIDYQDTKDPAVRSQRLLNCMEEQVEPIILVGSSMGGYVSLAASATQSPSAMFLLAPAINLPGYPTEITHTPDCDITIVHGWNDDVVPVQTSLDYAERCKATLHVLNGDHRLVDVLDTVLDLFSDFLEQQLLKKA